VCGGRREEDAAAADRGGRHHGGDSSSGALIRAQLCPAQAQFIIEHEDPMEHLSEL
jgi:hypothetical protein